MSPRRDGVQARRFREPLASEQRSARWAHKLTELSEQVPTPARSGVRARLLGWLARLFTVASVLPFLERAEHADAGRYQHDSEAIAAMAIDEGSHARALTRLRESDGTDDPRSIQHRERWHRGDRSGALHAAVFGVNDGLVSNTSLVMGVAGSGASGSTARQLFVGVGAALLVYMIGHVVGVRGGA